MNDKTININVPVLARVEGEGALEFSITDGEISNLRLRIYEPPRYFEKFLEGRSYQDLADTVARICGICPVAYQMTAVQAIESIFQSDITPWTHAMRRVFYCGEWIQSHALHIHMLAAPDFLGCQSIIELAQKDGEAVRRGLRLQTLGNDLIRLFGGRSVHPVGAKVGGFYQAPTEDKVAQLIPQLETGWHDSEQLILWLNELELPDDPQSFTSVAMHHPNEYPINEGRIVSDQGLNIDITEYQQHFTEQQVPHSTALHSLLDGKPYLLGPLARLNLNHQQLSAEVLSPLAKTQYSFPSNNMYHSIIARAVEIRFAIGEALKVLRDYHYPEQSSVETSPQAGTGFGCTEAPRGLLWHRYTVDKQGDILNAVIVPPTSQNQARIEQDVARSLENYGLEHTDDELRFYAERVVRNYDPCISCATHFLNLSIERDNKEAPINKPNLFLHDILLIAIGSPFGADNTAWQVADQLSQISDFNIIYSSQPINQLKPLLDSTKQVAILDVAISNQPAGSLLTLQSDQLETPIKLSSHALSTVDLLHLFEELRFDKQRIKLFGISVTNENSLLDKKLIIKASKTLKKKLLSFSP